ncbi:MAG: FAD-dependent oxidoreductase [Planctomycetota bacterium]
MSAEPVHEPARDVPVVHEADVCVIGGSCTGVFAAAAAARLGARVALVEAQGMLGGMATAGLVAIWHSVLDAEFGEQVIAGLTVETIERLDARGALIRMDENRNKAFSFSPAELTLELDRLLAGAGVRAFLHARFAAPVMDGGRVTAAVIEDKSGRRAIRARVFIDASGDGDLAHRAGLECYSMGDLQPPTTCAVIRGLEELERRNPEFSLNRAVFDPTHEGALELGFLWSSELPLGEDLTLVAGTRVHGADCSDADQLTAAEVEGRAQVRRIVSILRGDFEGGESVRLVSLPASIGIRQTRQVRCLHELTEEEVLSGERFEDAVANGTYRVDVHHNDRAGITFRYLDGREVFCKAEGGHERGRWRPETGENPLFYQIPYRSLVPRGAENVLVAGRCLDADRGAFGAVRVMVNTNQTGEAAGAAAWLALDSGKPVAEIDTAKLRETLKAGGAAII